MITVAGLNTAIDRLLDLDTLVPGAVQRVREVAVTPGGKGVHVAQTIAALGEAVRLVGLSDAVHHQAISERLDARGVRFEGVITPHALRCCFALRERDGRMTEILEPGPWLDADDRQLLLDSVHACLADSSALVLTGSLPGGFAADSYAHLLRQAGALPCLLDASGEALRVAASAAPYVLKCNQDEAAQLGAERPVTPGQAAALLRRMRARGVARPIITLGAQGAVAADGDVLWHAALELSGARHPVGSGDCLLAGVAVGLLRYRDMAQVLRLGVACGGANAINEETGYVRRADVERLETQVRLTRLHD